MTIYLVTSMPKIHHIYTVYIWFWPTLVFFVCQKYTVYTPHRKCTALANCSDSHAKDTVYTPFSISKVLANPSDFHAKNTVHTPFSEVLANPSRKL